MSKRKAELEADVHERALKGFHASWEATREQRRQSLEDRKFYAIAGAQWSEHAFEKQFENKPRLEVNKVHLAVKRVINEYRNNRVDVIFSPKDGSKGDLLADNCAALYRADTDSGLAQEAFDTGFEECVGGGLGAWRLRAVYDDIESEDNDRQRYVLEPLPDADQLVYWDVDCRTQDKSSCKRWWLLTAMTVDGYRDEYDDDPSTWPKQSWGKDEFEWCTPDIVYVCEYYEVEETKDAIEIWVHPATDVEVRKIKSRLDEAEKLELEEGQYHERDQLRMTGHKLDRTKPIKRKRIHKWLLSGNGIIEDSKYICGKHSPIIVVFGQHRVVDNLEHWEGHVRLSKDAQRLKNVMLSKLAEIAGKSSVEKPILHPEEIAGHEKLWSEDNVADYPYMLMNPLRNLSGEPIYGRPLNYTKPPVIPEALAALLQITEQDLKDILGSQQAGEEMVPNTSGRLMELVQEKLDMQAFIYIDNFKIAVKATGEAWLSGARDLYVEEGRKMKGIDRKGESYPVEIGKQTVNKQGVRVAENDLSAADFEARAEVGPATKSQRKSIVRTLLNLLQFVDDPEDRKVILSMIFANMEGEGLSDVRQYFRQRLLRMGVVEPTKEEKVELEKEAANKQPDANEQYLRAAADQAQADAMQSRANVVLKVEQANKAKAETLQIASEIDAGHQAQALEIIDRVAPKLTAAAEAPASAPAAPVETPPTETGQ